MWVDSLSFLLRAIEIKLTVGVSYMPDFPQNVHAISNQLDIIITETTHLFC